LTLALCLPGCGAGGEEPTSAAAPSALRSSAQWAEDDRLAPLVVQCYGLGHFDADTSDMLPVLIAKLQNSRLDVLRNVREELAGLGEPAIVELDRLVRRLYSDAHASHTIMNALGVVQLSSAGGGERAQALLRHCLGHPQETIRNAAVRALARHARPESYDDLLALLRVTQNTTQEVLITALYQADRRRLEREAAGWMQARQYPELLRHAAWLIAQGADAETARLFGPLVAQVEDRGLRALLVATQSAAEELPDEPFALLAEMLRDSDARARMQALTALEFTGATRLIAPVLVTDPVPELRLMACGLLGARVAEPLARDALYAGLNDASDSVREAALSALLAAGDESAADSALALLDGPSREVGIATRALKGRWEANPGLGARALALLRGRFEARAAEPLVQRQFLAQALAQIPGPESTRYLVELAGTLVETIDRVPAQRWLLLQASNTGPAGAAYLRELFRTELDPLRRFELLWCASLGHDDETRDFLLEVLEAEGSAPHERLYVAERLAREGPAQRVAPSLKRANLRMTDPVFRPAMECLLWRWYG
jgi:HEAT repeat protein